MFVCFYSYISDDLGSKLLMLLLVVLASSVVDSESTPKRGVFQEGLANIYAGGSLYLVEEKC